MLTSCFFTDGCTRWQFRIRNVWFSTFYSSQNYYKKPFHVELFDFNIFQTFYRDWSRNYISTKKSWILWIQLLSSSWALALFIWRNRSKNELRSQIFKLILKNILIASKLKMCWTKFSQINRWIEFDIPC